MRPLEQLCSDDEQEVLIFVSDIHLDPNANRDLDPSGFFNALERSVPSDCSRLFILGDLFETWVGDDLLTISRQAFIEALALFRHRSTHEIKLYLMHGNRDFLIGKNFCDDSKACLTGEVLILEMFGFRVGLTHGDALCLDDLDYQHFRRQVRQEKWQKAFLAKPLVQRQALALSIRAESEQAKQVKPMAIMDVNPAAVEAFVTEHRLQAMIHGHTHRPAQHAGIYTRWVLPDWDLAQQRGGWLRWDKSGFTAQGPFGAWA
ncbi:MAG: UDP-2,3-diacylglucosamine diphosphatase [Betaproteobacteria bacterium]|jgi:UDP-2,3-diacylglucosamine hydrolase|nr:UDP-2,3-diacylglucosamine diphosphatase [Pseudomonadota bacterium]NBO04992.1 UDP-2,3-diacylglucosamine diphosphatase [Betaproteobacteria bacterium]NBO94317.1 UDP-2,3-diacylglucosamine diphosphatase [Betaproteobacteria bacterium]NBP34223.1 UDP-2,3-diacylglucosamine diphosphatase [Betaproteobacteria bacterium]NBP38135.1 UDP-2,3-diacylglucosamine diphosphatase [Betaproteobacteria bacterium]